MNRMSGNRFLKVILIMNALASEAIAGKIPVPWIGMALAVIPAASIILNGNIAKLPRVFLQLVFWCIIYSIIISVVYFEYYCDKLPPKATTTYPIFVSLRYFHLIAFASMALFVYVLCSQGKESQSIDVVVKLGAIVACYAIYVYFAHILDLPELLPRSRMGTGLGEQVTTFSVLGNRALGSFREPSQLGQWLMLPFTLSFIIKHKHWKHLKIVICVAILLSASMSAIMSLAIGLFVSLGLIRWSSFRNRIDGVLVKRTLGGMVLVTAIALIIDYGLSGRFFDTIAFRTSEILDSGLRGTNRSFLYKYLDTLPEFPWFGVGLGNANIDFSNALGHSGIVSFPNLYVNTLLSSGIIGSALYFFLLAYPVIKALADIKNTSRHRNFFFILWAYIAWLIDFGVHSEELPIMFGFAYALLLYQSYRTVSYTYRSRSNSGMFGIHAKMAQV